MIQPIHLATGYTEEWFSLNVSNGSVALSVVPSIGGRVMDLSLGPTRAFYTNPRLRGKTISGSPGIRIFFGTKLRRKQSLASTTRLVQ